MTDRSSHAALRAASSPAAAAARDERIDLARGLAIVQMIAYHFCYDLNHYGWLHLSMLADPRWIAWRSAIVTQFLFLLGVSLALRGAASARGTRPNLRRVGQIAACALLVSAASAVLFGARWIWFGVLHFATFAQLAFAPLSRRAAFSLAAGAVALAAGLTVRLPSFAPDALSWIGFSPVKPQTEDFVPLLPWSGVVLLGIGSAALWLRRRAPAPAAAVPAPLGWIAFLGRWPLTVYMLHQPLLFGLLSLVGHRG